MIHSHVSRGQSLQVSRFFERNSREPRPEDKTDAAERHRPRTASDKRATCPRSAKQSSTVGVSCSQLSITPPSLSLVIHRRTHRHWREIGRRCSFSTRLPEPCQTLQKTKERAVSSGLENPVQTRQAPTQLVLLFFTAVDIARPDLPPPRQTSFEYVLDWTDVSGTDVDPRDSQFRRVVHLRTIGVVIYAINKKRPVFSERPMVTAQRCSGATGMAEDYGRMCQCFKHLSSGSISRDVSLEPGK